MKQYWAYYFPFHIGNIGFVVVVVTLKENSKGFKKMIIVKDQKISHYGKQIMD